MYQWTRNLCFHRQWRDLSGQPLRQSRRACGRHLQLRDHDAVDSAGRENTLRQRRFLGTRRISRSLQIQRYRIKLDTATWRSTGSGSQADSSASTRLSASTHKTRPVSALAVDPNNGKRVYAAGGPKGAWPPQLLQNARFKSRELLRAGCLMTGTGGCLLLSLR